MLISKKFFWAFFLAGFAQFILVGKHYQLKAHKSYGLSHWLVIAGFLQGSQGCVQVLEK